MGWADIACEQDGGALFVFVSASNAGHFSRLLQCACSSAFCLPKTAPQEAATTHPTHHTYPCALFLS